ncbi:hypothetical protein [Pseudoalteromonas sp. OOF1S-7]|uniref:hypothetical protein n=1 Tax=Pseudoalteromonas sp. OOF1S-7 TaxID=2917757 RepID=UPI001EF62163|nr:hypothetical protein [Pseudoalteromonas sp. OOF1S-7]MCG7533530.1 hypothetical protein [Pseudoalteromonas sp. OOF1S-7]
MATICDSVNLLFLIVKLPSSVNGNSTQELLQFMGELQVSLVFACFLGSELIWGAEQSVKPGYMSEQHIYSELDQTSGVATRVK